MLLTELAKAQPSAGLSSESAATWTVLRDIGVTTGSIELEAGSRLELARIHPRANEAGAALSEYRTAARLWAQGAYKGELHTTLTELCDTAIRAGMSDETANLLITYLQQPLQLSDNDPLPFRATTLSNLALALPQRPGDSWTGSACPRRRFTCRLQTLSAPVPPIEGTCASRSR